jgi:hypothetical protein
MAAQPQGRTRISRPHLQWSWFSCFFSLLLLSCRLLNLNFISSYLWSIYISASKQYILSFCFVTASNLKVIISVQREESSWLYLNHWLGQYPGLGSGCSGIGWRMGKASWSSEENQRSIWEGFFRADPFLIHWPSWHSIPSPPDRVTDLQQARLFAFWQTWGFPMRKTQHWLKGGTVFGTQHTFCFPLGHTFGSNDVPSAATASFVFVSGWV